MYPLSIKGERKEGKMSLRWEDEGGSISERGRGLVIAFPTTFMLIYSDTLLVIFFSYYNLVLFLLI
jgi:hypothetical protein